MCVNPSQTEQTEAAVKVSKVNCSLKTQAGTCEDVLLQKYITLSFQSVTKG